MSAVSEVGGHLGSNLGAVELTLALHRVFESPTDAILWDTGHQAYVHKIVTGRQAQFETLRQAGGLSGYPSREESEHDLIENSHASTVLSYADGIAAARDLGTNDRRHVVAVIGDGAMTGGMAYEALNNMGHHRRGVIVILNDNGRSYAPTISNLSANSQGIDEQANHPSIDRPTITDRVTGKLSHALTDIRQNPVYVRRQRRIEEFLHGLPVVGNQAGSAMDAFKAGVREFLQPPSFFEALGARYIGPFDGHNVAEMEAGAPQRDRTLERRPDRRPRPHAEGSRLLACRRRRREEPPRRSRVRCRGRAAQGGLHRLHPGLLRRDRQGGRSRPSPRGDHRGDARTDRSDPVPGTIPRPVLRRRHRRTARRHERRRHGDGRPAPGRRHLLDVPQPRRGTRSSTTSRCTVCR